MSIPNRIKQEHEEAVKMAADYQEKLGSATAVADDPAPVAPDKGIPDQESQDADTDVVEGQAEPKADETVESQQPTQPEPVDNSEFDKMKQRLAVLKGKYDAEVPRLAAENRLLKEQISAAAQVTKPVATAPSPSQPEKPVDVFDELGIPEDQRDAWDKDSVELMKQIAGKMATEMVQPIQRELAESRRKTFEQRLDEAVPEWQEWNESESWQSWLADADPWDIRPRQDILETLVEANDVKRIANLFNRWRTDTGQQEAVRPPVQETPTTVASQVTPAPRANGRPVQAQQKPAMSLKKIDQMFSAMTAGKVTQETAARWQKEIDDAIRENRVTA